MKKVIFSPDKVLGLFREHKVLTKEDVLEACGCATMTFWKILHNHGYITSYNFNAMYYTLLDIPTFDELGLWSYKGIGFSRYGSLSDTLIELIERSELGYTAKELTQLLDVKVAPELSRLHCLGRVQREKMHSSFVYVASQDIRRQARAVGGAEFLVDNLNNETYVELVYDGSLKNLAKRFAEHWPEIARLSEQDDRGDEQGTLESRTGHRLRVSKSILRSRDFFNMMSSAMRQLGQ